MKAQGKPLHKIIIESAALYFGVDPDELQNGKVKTYEDSYKRHICFYLIRKNSPAISRKVVADLFKCGGSTVKYGEDKISSDKEIYSETLGNVRDIQDLIDNFKKKLRESWLSQSNN